MPKARGEAEGLGSKVGSGLVILTGLALIGSAAAKIAHVPKVVADLGSMGFDHNKLLLIAVLESVGALLFLAPRTRSIGLLMLSAYLGGAIATHIQHAKSPIQPMLFLGLLWFGAWLRHPQILWSLHTEPTKQLSGNSRRVPQFL